MRRSLVLPVVAALLASPSCRNPFADDVVSVAGTVHYYSFEGGFWAVLGNDGTTYDPLGGLPQAFQEEGLRVWLVAKLRSDLGSYHMAGPIVEIISIRRR